MANEERRMINHYPAARLYTVNRAEYKLMVRSLTSNDPDSSGQTSVSVPTQGQISNPQSPRLNDAFIPLDSSGQINLDLPAHAQAQVSNPQPMRLNDASISLGSSEQTSLGLPTQAQAQVSNPQPMRLNDASIPVGSSGQTSLGLPTQAQAQVSNSQSMRLNDASIPLGSSGQTSLGLPTQVQAQVSNPQEIRLDDTSIPAVSSGQTSLLFSTHAHVRNPRSIGLYDSFPLHNRSLPYPFPSASVCPSTSAVGLSDAQASSSRPSLPSAPVPSSVPTMLLTSPPSISSPPLAPLVPARLPTPSLPPSAPVIPSPPREQGAMEPSLAARIESVENFLTEDDDDYNFLVLSSFNHEIGTSNGEQQHENVALPFVTNVPSGSLDLPVQQNGVTMPMSEHGPYENVAPQVHATLPSVSQHVPDFTYGIGSGNNPPPVAASVPSMDLLNMPNYQHLVSEGLAPLIHATLPSENLSTWSNSQNGLGSSNVPPHAIYPSGSLQGGPYSQNFMPSGNFPPHATYPYGNLQGWPHSQNILPSGYFLPHATFPYGSLQGWPYSQNFLPSGNFPSQASFPSGSLQGWPHSQNILPLGYFPPTGVAPYWPNHGNDQQWGNALPAFPMGLPYESQQGWPNLQNGLQQGIVPANAPYGQTAYGGSSSLTNYPNTQEDMEHYLAQVGFGTVPSLELNWNTYPRVIQGSTDVPSSSSPPANLPLDNPQE